jgi:hypothetical protein
MVQASRFIHTGTCERRDARYLPVAPRSRVCAYAIYVRWAFVALCGGASILLPLVLLAGRAGVWAWARIAMLRVCGCCEWR